MDFQNSMDNLITTFANKIKELKSNYEEGDIIELEARLGCIKDLQSDHRLFLPTESPVIFNKNMMYVFNPGVSQNDFNFFLNEISKKNLKKKNIKDVTKMSKKRTRATFIDKKIVEHVKKTKLINFDIHIPQSSYDIRFSLALEKKLKLENFKDDGAFKRNRDRISYEEENTSYDLTKVENEDLDFIYEVEMETCKFSEEKDLKEEIKEFIGKSYKFLGSRKIE